MMAIHKAPAASSPRCFFAAARTLDSGFWINPIHTTTKYFYGFRLDRAPDRVPSPDATFSWSPDSGLWILDWAHSAYLPLPPSGRRTPDPGLRTPDPGRTPDSGLRTPDSGLRTRDCPLLTNLSPPCKYFLDYGAGGFRLKLRKPGLANLFQSWRWRCAHAAGVVLNVSRMSERRCTQQGCLPSAHDLEIPEDLRHYARRHLPGSVCSRAGRPSTRLRSRGPSRARA